MKFTPLMLGKALLAELSKGYDPVRISRRCYHLYLEHARQMDPEVQNLLIELFTMEDDPQFELTEKDMLNLIDKLLAGEPL